MRVDTLIVAFLVALFGFSAVDKILHMDGFINAINNYRIIPWRLGFLLAPAVVAAEFMIALGLLRAPWRRTAALQGALLMAIFTFALGVNDLYGDRGVCGCWFSITMAEGLPHYLLNGLLIALCLSVYGATRPALTQTAKVAA